MTKRFNLLTESILLDEEDIKDAISQFAIFVCLDESLLTEDASDILKKLGLHVKKNKGLLHYIAQAGMGMFKLLKAAIAKDKEEVLKVIQGISKEEIVDFIFKLDAASLHILSAPLHFIEAVTGLHLGANLDAVGKSVIDAVKKSYKTIVKHIDKIIGHNDQNAITLADIGQHLKAV
jgi:hypothetical protein